MTAVTHLYSTSSVQSPSERCFWTNGRYLWSNIMAFKDLWERRGSICASLRPLHTYVRINVGLCVFMYSCYEWLCFFYKDPLEEPLTVRRGVYVPIRIIIQKNRNIYIAPFHEPLKGIYVYLIISCKLKCNAIIELPMNAWLYMCCWSDLDGWDLRYRRRSISLGNPYQDSYHCRV